MFGVKYGFSFSFFPRWVILQHHLLKNPSLPSHLFFLCVDFYIVLKFISKYIVLLVLAVLNVFPIRRINCLILVHNKFIAFCLLVSMPHFFPEFSHSVVFWLIPLDFQMFHHVIAT